MVTTMSGHTKAHWHIVALSYACSSCGAGPGQECISSTSLQPRSTEVHVARSNAAAARQWVAADMPLDERICEECGDDLATYGYRYCSDCMERLGHDADI